MRRLSRCLLILASLSLGAGGVTGGGAAWAQTMLRDQQAVAVCLCLEQSLATRLQRIEAAKQRFEQTRAEIAAEAAALETLRQGVDVSDETAIERFRDRLEKHLARQHTLDTEIHGAWDEEIRGYEDRRSQFAERCAGRTYETGMVNRLKGTLDCRID